MRPEEVFRQLTQGAELQRAGKLEAAEKIYRAVLDEQADNPDANHLLGLIYGDRDEYEHAVGLIEKAISIKSDAAPFYHNIAGLYRRVGRISDAELAFRRAIELAPDYAEAYQGLSEMLTFEPGDPLEQATLGNLTGELSDGAAAFFHFTLGKIYDDTERYALAFNHYARANQLTHRTFDIRAYQAFVKESVYQFSPRLARSMRKWGVLSERPVFIVGMPRSGTTLVEQILASHSAVAGAGELSDIKSVARAGGSMVSPSTAYPALLPRLGPDQLRSMAEQYLSRTQRFVTAREITRVVDKHPLNFQFLGLILLMFPRAKVIHTVRHPLDTCLSCFFQHFTRGQDYTFDLTALGLFYNEYRRLMEHWHQLFGHRILHLEYERLLVDQENMTRRLLKFCDLDFEPACLEFFATDRPVKTASFMQVRQPLYSTSRDRWKNYTEQLRPLVQIIGVSTDAPVMISGARPF
jgi:tetratricopeptide (TPR) repeat protein